jgi:hypothetical protein
MSPSTGERLYTYDVTTLIALVANFFSAGFSAVLAQMSLLVAVIAESGVWDQPPTRYHRLM